MSLLTCERLYRAGQMGPLPVRVAHTMGRLGGETREDVLLAAALVTNAVLEGHVALRLEGLRGPLTTEPVPRDGAPPIEIWDWPDESTWRGALETSPLVSQDPTVRRPLFLDASGRLYLRRYFDLESRLARHLRERAGVREAQAASVATEALDRLFPGVSAADPQRVAAETALRRRLTVISGGPGTGKTSTVVKILALLVEAAHRSGAPAPRIGLAAPTGKAAARLIDSVLAALDRLPVTDAVLAAIPAEARTVHRLLGVRRDRTTEFRHGPDHLLPLDVLVVDEASMVDLALMCRLFDAVPPACRVILLGDRDQLASVEAGAVLGDLGAAGSEGGPLAGTVVSLTTSYRYDAAGALGRLAAAIQRGDAETSLAILRDRADPSVRLVASGRDPARSAELREAVLGAYPALGESVDPSEALGQLGRLRVLAAHRRGPFGVEGLNPALERLLEREGRLQPRADGLYVGRPVLVTRNDAARGLYNGDIGLFLPATGAQRERGRANVQVYFPGLRDGAPRVFGASRLPPHETVFAMTVHKSQGSEFDHVVVVLPREPSGLTTRELLYTAVTRARRSVLVLGSEDVVRHAVATPTRRSSGLLDRLTDAEG